MGKKKDPGKSKVQGITVNDLMEELYASKGLVVSLLLMFGGKATIPNWILDKAPHKGDLFTNMTAEGMVVEYKEYTE